MLYYTIIVLFKFFVFKDYFWFMAAGNEKGNEKQCTSRNRLWSVQRLQLSLSALLAPFDFVHIVQYLRSSTVYKGKLTGQY